MLKIVNRFIRDEKGTAIIELAILIPVIITLVFGYIFFMNGVKDTIVMRTAAREAARVYASPIADSSGDPIDMYSIAVGKAYEELSQNGIKGATVKAYPDGYKRYVEIEKPFITRLPQANLKLKAGAVFYCETVDEEIK
ncbi:TadE/TadG family type IV pilus assembly protein [Wukongibacter baidiensis]